jgi:hypothetical protein
VEDRRTLVGLRTVIGVQRCRHDRLHTDLEEAECRGWKLDRRRETGTGLTRAWAANACIAALRRTASRESR